MIDRVNPYKEWGKRLMYQELPEDELDKYRQAASETGYRITVIAKGGERYSQPFLIDNNSGDVRRVTFEMRSIVVRDGFIAITVDLPEYLHFRRAFLEDKLDHIPFYRTLDRLR